MMDTITKQAAIEAVEALISGTGSRDGWTHDGAIEQAIAAINALPAVDDRAAIIEECARVAENWQWEPHVGEEIANAIRALAD